MFLLKRFGEKIPWDKELPPEITNIWLKWENVLPSHPQLPRLQRIELLIFRDASIVGKSTVGYAVIQQTSSTTQRFVSSKSRLSKKNTSMPRLELIAEVVVEHLTENITNSLQRSKVTAVHGWSDSMVVIYWLKRNGTYKQFVQNRYKVTKEKEK